MSSIGGRLTRWLLIAVLAFAVLQAAVSYRAALEEADELFDYHIRQLALALQDHPGGIVESMPEAHEEEFDFVVHIWSAEGERIYQSHAHVSLPDRTVLGYSTVHTPEGEWRVFGIQASRRIIQIAQPMRVRQRIAAEMALGTLTPLLVLAALLAIVVFLTVRSIVHPLDRLARTMESRDIDAASPLAEQGVPGEIAPLVRAFNQLLARLGTALGAQRAFVADAAHELRSPIAALKLQLQLLERATGEQDRRDLMTRLAAGIERAARLIDQLLMLARSEPGAAGRPMTAVRLDEVARLAVADCAAEAHERHIDLGVTSAHPTSVRGDSEALRVLARNLIDNAVRYTPEGGRVDVSVRVSATQATLEVADSGPGIPAEERSRVFDRFYRHVGSGTTGSGLGLAIVRAIAEQHQATVQLGESAVGGLIVRVVLPRTDESAL